MADVFISKTIGPVIGAAGLERLRGSVAIKVHFGEKGCTTFMDPNDVRQVWEAVVQRPAKAALVESSVLYRSPRIARDGHIRLATAHGFGFAPIDILDGEKGERSLDLCLDGPGSEPVRLAEGLKKYDSLVVITHFKGHAFAGYGGLFKNIGMGLSSRAGKLHMHAGVSPRVKKEACINCGACIRACGSKAIEAKEAKAWINPGLCTGCAMCIAVCPEGAVAIPWAASTSEALQKKIVDYARGVFGMVPVKRCVFITIMKNITPECDCMGVSQEPFMEDIGYLTSSDPVSLEAACLELADKHSKGRFGKINPHSKSIQIGYAEESGLGTKSYRLIMI